MVWCHHYEHGSLIYILYGLKTSSHGGWGNRQIAKEEKLQSIQVKGDLKILHSEIAVLEADAKELARSFVSCNF